MERKLTCIVCPLGCEMNVKSTDGGNVTVCGNNCPRGEKYAVNECSNPQRTVTSTVKSNDGITVSVKTLGTIPKDKVFECMKIINKAKVCLPISVGDVIIKDVFGTDIVATQNVF